MTADVGFLRELVTTPGPSGFEEPVQEVVRRRFAAVAAPETDVLGNVVATVNRRVAARRDRRARRPARSAGDLGRRARLRLLRQARRHRRHAAARPGRRLWGRDGAVDGVIGKRPTHLIPEAERGKAPEIADSGSTSAPATAPRRSPASPAATRSPSLPTSSSSAAASSPAAASTTAPASTWWRGPSSSTRLIPAPPSSPLSRRSRKRQVHGGARAVAPPAARLRHRRRRRVATDQPEVDSGAPAAPPRSAADHLSGRRQHRAHRACARWRPPRRCRCSSRRSRRHPDRQQWLQTTGAGAAALNLGIRALHALAPRGRAPRRPRSGGAAHRRRRASSRRVIKLAAASAGPALVSSTPRPRGAARRWGRWCSARNGADVA